MVNIIIISNSNLLWSYINNIVGYLILGIILNYMYLTINIRSTIVTCA